LNELSPESIPISEHWVSLTTLIPLNSRVISPFLKNDPSAIFLPKLVGGAEKAAA